MFEYKFTKFPARKVKFEEERYLTVNDIIFTIDEIKAIYVREYDLFKNQWNSIYISTDGNDAPELDLLSPQLIQFKKKEQEKIDELLNIFKEKNIEIITTSDKIPSPIAPNISRIENEGSHIQAGGCPNCGSLDLQFMQNKRKGFSVGKAVGGGLLTGGIGTLAGFAGKKGKKNEFYCNNCGNIFSK